MPSYNDTTFNPTSFITNAHPGRSQPVGTHKHVAEVVNGGTGLNSVPRGSILMGGTAAQLEFLPAAPTATSILGNYFGVPNWVEPSPALAVTAPSGPSGPGYVVLGQGPSSHMTLSPAETMIFAPQTQTLSIGNAETPGTISVGTLVLKAVAAAARSTLLWLKPIAGSVGAALQFLGISSQAAGAVVTDPSSSGSAELALCPPTAGIPLVSGESNLDPPAFGTASVAGGGTGQTSFPPGGVLVGSNQDAIETIRPDASPFPLVSAGTGANPVFQMLTVQGGGTGLTAFSAGDLMVGNSGSALTALGIGPSGRILTSSGSAPEWLPPAIPTQITTSSLASNTNYFVLGSTVQSSEGAEGEGSIQTGVSLAPLMFSSSQLNIGVPLTVPSIVVSQSLYPGPSLIAASASGEIVPFTAGTAHLPLVSNGTGLPSYTVLSVAGGGTSFSHYALGEMLYGNASGDLSVLPIGSPGQLLSATSSGPAWSSPAAPSAPRIFIFTVPPSNASASFSYTSSSNCTGILVQVHGAGGSGSGQISSTGDAAGGGGAGAYVWARLAPIQNANIVVGAGGPGSNPGTAGNPSSISWSANGVSLSITAEGGQGSSATASPGTGAYSYGGAGGSFNVVSNSSFEAIGVHGKNGGLGVPISGGLGVPGIGGMGSFGGSASAGSIGCGSDGQSDNNYSATGGNGIVVITEYY